MKRSLILIFSILLLLSISNLAHARKVSHSLINLKTAKLKTAAPVTAPVTVASQTETLTQPEENGLSPAGQSLEQDLLTAVQSFDRDVQLYHYFEAPQDQSDSKKISPYFDNFTNREQWVSYFMGFRTGAFWDPNNHVTELINAGPGMYLAVDPDASREFGESAVIFKVPKGLKYLSILRVIALRKQTRDLLVQENVISEDQFLGGATTLGLTRGFAADALKNMVREENENFKKLVNQIFSRNQIMFIEYPYKSYLAGFCKTASQSAFVFVGEAPQSNEPNENGEVLGQIPSSIGKGFLFSDFDIQNLSEDETHEKDLMGRFRNVLAGIREKGVGEAQNLMNQYLNDKEINELAGVSYRCERRN